MSKEAWKAAKAELDAIEAERDALIKVAVEPIRERWEAAQAKLDDIEEDCPERVGWCEGCQALIWDGEPYSYDSENSVYMCEACTPTYADMQANPENFYDLLGDHLTPETAKVIIDDHLAGGGALTDKVGLRQ